MPDAIHLATNPANPAESSDGSPWRVLRAIIDSLADGIVIVDADGAVRFANPAAGRLFNRSPDELVGTMLGLALVAGETTEMQIVRRGGGDVVHAELRVVNTEWNGAPADLVSLRDITDRKHAEERSRQLVHEREARLQAESASRTKSDFLAIMSHELRTPLNAILGYSELIDIGISGEISAPVREQIGRIRISAKHLLGLVNDILDLAKVEAGRLVVASAPANVAETVGSALTLIQPQADARNLKIVVDRGIDSVPPFVGDSERTRQILVNLLSNAVKCTEPGGSITVTGALVVAGGLPPQLASRRPHVRLSVTDTGIGIPADKLAVIFEPFVQADTGHKRAQEGSGLGLTVAQRLARAMGGDLTVESTAGVGSSFSVWLPADSAESETAGAIDAGEADDASAEGGVRRLSRADRPEGDLKGLEQVARAMLAELDVLVSVVVSRIRCDPVLAMASGLRTSQVTDHLATLIADVAGALIVVEETCGKPSPLLADAMEIQRLVAERHGSQRARLGWTEAAMRREFMIIREELLAVVRRGMPPGGLLSETDAVNTVNRFIDQAEYIGVRVLESELPG